MTEENEDVESIDVRCLNCRKWFPSPIFISPWNSLAEATLFGNLAQCPHCREMTPCNKENYRVRFKNGGFMGSDAV